MPSPHLERRVGDGVAFYTDPVLEARHGVLVAFTERGGGASLTPYASLNLAAHTGDLPSAVDENRSRLLNVLGIGRTRDRLTTAEQVHGDRIAEVRESDAGAGARAEDARPPIPSSDALMTALTDTPLLLCYADCVPVVLVATAPVRTVAVVHAGWRGALAKLPAKAVRALCERASCEPADVLAYVGPHVCGTCYEVGDELLSQFAASFDTIHPAQGRLDLGAVVSGTLRDAGVPVEHQARVGACTAETTARFFSYRSEGVTGRHGALAVVLRDEDGTDL